MKDFILMEMYSKCVNKFLPLSVVALTVLVVGCSGGSNSTDEGLSQVNNPFDNGYRLSKVTGDNLFVDSLDFITDFDYSTNNNQIVRTTEYFNRSTADRINTRNFTINDGGWLIGGNYLVNDVIKEFVYSYDDQGDLIGYDDFYNLNFEHQNNRLNKITYSTFSASYSYGSNDQLVAVNDSHSRTTTSMEYNAEGQISRATETDYSDNPGFVFEYEYDANSNMVKRTKSLSTGEVFDIKIYEYEKSNRPMYNHQLFKILLEPFDSEVFDFLSEG